MTKAPDRENSTSNLRGHSFISPKFTGRCAGSSKCDLASISDFTAPRQAANGLRFCILIGALNFQDQGSYKCPHLQAYKEYPRKGDKYSARPPESETDSFQQGSEERQPSEPTHIRDRRSSARVAPTKES